VSELKKCPFCAEEIQAYAIECKHCSRTLDSEPKPTTPTKTDLLTAFMLVIVILLLLNLFLTILASP
jgi:hypothetical protein